jgi:pantoate--beta-alanine ligase
MEICRTIAEIRAALRPLRQASKRIGFVPTMGYLHEGHLTLVDIARANSDIVVMSIFVNPTQFAPNEDLERYPRDFNRDERLARERGVDLLFYPDEQEMYPQPYYTYVITEQLSKVLCGISRPTHFRGVTTVVCKLFNIVQPDVAIFGQKDAQQAIIIRRMVMDLNFPIEIIVAPIVREADGLAMSSRNVYLSPEERIQAPVIYQALQAARKAVAKGERRAAVIHGLIAEKIKTASLARVDYIEIVDGVTLERVTEINPGAFAAVAVFFGKTRLIDNQILL